MNCGEFCESLKNTSHIASPDNCFWKLQVSCRFTQLHLYPYHDSEFVLCAFFTQMTQRVSEPISHTVLLDSRLYQRAISIELCQQVF